MSEQQPQLPEGVLRPWADLSEEPEADDSEFAPPGRADDPATADTSEPAPPSGQWVGPTPQAFFGGLPSMGPDVAPPASDQAAGPPPADGRQPGAAAREADGQQPVADHTRPQPSRYSPSTGSLARQDRASQDRASQDRASQDRASQDRASQDRASSTAAPSASAAGQTKIGLWGSTGSGKTTFLAALRHAVSQEDRSSGKWVIYPLDDRSERMMTDFSHQLVQTQRFPEPTDLGAVYSLQWDFIGDLTGSRFAPKRRMLRRGPAASRFVLDLIDVSGEAFSHAPADRQTPVPPHVVERALEHLAQSQGLIYLFDPITERDRRAAADYLDRTLTQLAGKIRRETPERMVGPHLPHHVSVCITKFDHPRLFQQARRAGLVNYGPDGMPRVLDEHAEAFFQALCDGEFWDERDEKSFASASWVRNQLRNYFHPDRIHYFVCSSIGFRRPPGWDPAASKRPGFQFNPQDFANIHESNGEVRIRGPINPVNVLEPLIVLQQRLTGRW
jgi:GTPase SAR1 family protein